MPKTPKANRIILETEYKFCFDYHLICSKGLHTHTHTRKVNTASAVFTDPKNKHLRWRDDEYRAAES